MVPISIRLKGFKGIKSGIGVDEINLDLSVLPPGVIAITGPNGSGKTTLIDNLQCFLTMPYKLRKSKSWDSNAFRASGGYYLQCEGSDACKELVFFMPGKGIYNSLILIDVPRKKQESYLYEQVDASTGTEGPGGKYWKPLNDGKSATYDSEIEKLVGSPALFFSSVFRSQGCRALSDYARSDIMGLLAELLNVDHIREQSDKSRAVVADLCKRVDLIRASVQPAQEDVDAAALVETQMQDAEGRLPALQTAVTAAQKVHEEAQAVVTKHNLEQASRESELARGALLRMQLADEQTRHSGEALRLGTERQEALQRQATETASHDTDIATLNNRISLAESSSAASLAGQLQSLNTRILDARTSSASSLAEQVAAIQVRLDRAKKITSGAVQIRAAASREPEVELTISRFTLGQTSAETELSRIQVVQSDAAEKLAAAQGALHAADVVLLARKGAVQSAQANADRLLTSNCPVDKPTCNFMGSAVSDREALPELLADVEEASKACEVARGDVVSALSISESAKFSVTAAQAEVARLRGELAQANTDLAELRRFTKLVPELDQAEEVIRVAEGKIVAAPGNAESELATVILQLESDIVACQEKHAADLAARVQQLEADLDARKRRCASACEEVAERLRSLAEAEKAEDAQHQKVSGRLDMELLTVPLYDDLSDILARATGDVLMALSDLNRQSEAVRTLEGEIAGHKAVLASVEGKRRTLLDADAQIAGYQRLIAEFSLLAKACSNDGVVALELDDAAPSIAAIVNDLLLKCYGSRYSIRFDTQAEKADGTKREAFDILVMDSELDSERSITDMSGGETSWLEDAITRGISLFNIHRCDRSYGAIFSDEKDGAMSPDRKAEFFAVKRAALAIGHHTREFFITQTSDLVDSADARIEMRPGGIVIQ